MVAPIFIGCGAEDLVVDPSSIHGNGRTRSNKTDRIDAAELLRMPMRYHGGKRQVWSVERVPREEEEYARNLYRELEVPIEADWFGIHVTL